MTTKRTAAALAVLLALTAPASAQTPLCDSVPAKQRPLVSGLLDSLHLYDCCDATISACLARKPRCHLALRLANDVCRQAKLGRSRAEIERSVTLRAQSMLPVGKPAAIQLDEAWRAGDAKAPVTAVIYACTRCPFCSKVTLALYREVTEGRLRGKVKLYFRPFPIKDHPGSLEGGLAIEAAARLGKAWPYLLEIYARFAEFCPALLADWAQALGLDRAEFERLSADGATRSALSDSKREGLRNRVTATPTLFISGRKYVGTDLDTAVLVDLLEEEHERVTKTDR